MRAREWEHVLRALQKLGCQVARENDEFTYVVRGAIRIYALRKSPVGVPAQRQLIGVLEFDEHEWAEALRATVS